MVRSVCCLVAKSCPTHCDPMNCSPPGSSAHGIFQARVLEWFAISFSKDPGIEPASLFFFEPVSLESPALAGRFFTTAPPRKPQVNLGYTLKGELTALPDGLGMGCEENVRIIPYPCMLSI